ncbi:hypothetical protein I2I11_00280 [Pontibacter sp. 172403-2]|uniref:hypothetical protein n=1 Tax=Pontibacter rufus TaxID=2791028 RepID=UPI0018B014A5|nr:hypothetical protein [Pontibacter sp. 172403-2]MBF9251721.1 hypothetical protein [Pontibacter sp. 172403-2]
MTDNPEENGNIGGENQRIGRELYQKDKEQSQSSQRYGYRGDNNRKWDAGNFFHTGPSSHGAQDAPERRYGNNYSRENQQRPTYERSRNQNEHYGNRPDSPYRNEQSMINHGNRTGHGSSYNYQGSFDDRSRPGNYSDMNNYNNDTAGREGPGTRSRYKEDDYRYGSGSHNWYREGRYTPDRPDHQHDQRGFFQRVKDGWNDIMHSDEPGYTPHSHARHDRFDRERRGSEVFRDRNYNKGYENGPRWADETDSGNDNYYNDTDRNQRYRR